MNCRFLPSYLSFVFSLLLAALAANAADKRAITEKDLFNFVWIGDAAGFAGRRAGRLRARDGE